MSPAGSRTAGYLVAVVLLVPLAVLAMFVLGWVGPTGFAIAAVVTGVAALAVWLTRSAHGSGLACGLTGRSSRRSARGECRRGRRAGRAPRRGEPAPI